VSGFGWASRGIERRLGVENGRPSLD